MPAVLLAGAMLLGFRGVEIVSLMLLYCVPTPVISFTMTRQMGGDSDLAGNLVVFSTAASAVTMVMWIYLIKELALF
jgi:predicted permease